MMPTHLKVEKFFLKIPKLSKFSAATIFSSWISISSWMGYLSIVNFVVTSFITYILTTNIFKRLANIAHTFPRDAKAIGLVISFKRIMYTYSHHEKNVVATFKKWVQKTPSKACFLYLDEIWTYKKVDEYSNRVANVFRNLGYVKGDVVCLMMENQAEYVGIWLGLAKLGVITALINYNLKQQSLLHSVTISEAKAIIFASSFANDVKDIKERLPKMMRYFELGDSKTNFADSLVSKIEHSSSTDPPQLNLQSNDRLIYIYTSGTTGLPKAAIISHLRFFFISTCGFLGCSLNASDRFYVPLPLYHSAGGIIGIGQALCFNVTVAIRKKFSASQFWRDCVRYRCTVSQYIGETCRYLMAQPVTPEETSHTIRALLGNGLKINVWDAFVSRFHIKDIVELYGATEGNANMANLDNTKGAVGFQPRAPAFLTPYMLIRVDHETGEPIRDKDGICVQCSVGEPGELVGRIDKSREDRNYDGYVTKSESEKKILHDVFGKGISAFATGDLLVMDEYGYFYFKDRTGDTFRWKGENVSTAEVEDVIGKIIGLKELTVYGVEVPGIDGRAGMVAIVDQHHSINLQEFGKAISKALPSYSRPVFIRITDHIPMTSTFKLRKLEMQTESFNPSKCRSDKLYFQSSPGCYELINERLYNEICNGNVKL